MENILLQIELFFKNIIDFDYLGFLSQVFGQMTFEGMLKFIVIYFFVVWVAIIIWVTRDIINRTNNIFYQIFAILIVLLGTPLGVVIYLLIRPSKTLFEKYYEESAIEEEYVDEIETNTDKKELKCSFCEYDIQEDYKFCPNCRKQLKKECIYCSKELSGKMDFCPFCGTDQERKVDKILSNNKSIDKDKIIDEQDKANKKENKEGKDKSDKKNNKK